MPFASALCSSTALMLKKFTSLTKVSSNIQSTPLELTQSPPLRRTYTAPDLIRPIVIEQRAQASHTSTTFEPLPEHDDSHAGPYGVEAPLHWDLVVKMTEVTVAVKVDGEKEGCQKPAHDSAVDGENRAEAKGK